MWQYLKGFDHMNVFRKYCSLVWNWCFETFLDEVLRYEHLNSATTIFSLSLHLVTHSRPWFSFNGLFSINSRFGSFFDRICNVEVPFYSFYKNTQDVTQIHFPWDAKTYLKAFVFYRNYTRLQGMWSDLLWCGLRTQTIFLQFWYLWT